MAIPPDKRYLLPRFAFSVLSDLAVRVKNTRGVIFRSNHYSRNIGRGIEAPRDTDANARVALAFRALGEFGRNGKKASRLVSKMIKRTEERTRELARRHSWYRRVEFKFGRTARGRRKPEPCKPSAVCWSGAKPNESGRGSRFAELDRLIAGARRRKAPSPEERRCNCIRSQAKAFWRKTPRAFFEDAFLRFCDERAATMRSPERLRRVEREYRERLEWFEEPEQREEEKGRSGNDYDPGRVTTRYGLAILLHELGRFDEALPLYAKAAELLDISTFPFLPEYRHEGLATLMRASEDCRTNRPVHRRGRGSL